MAGGRYLHSASGVTTQARAAQTSAAAGDADKLIRLDSAGKLDASFMPSGFGAETKSVVTSENLAAGDAVNLYNNGGTLNARKADNSNGRRAHGFVLSATTSPAAATVYYGQIEVADYTSLTPGGTCWLGTTGRATQTPPSGSGVVSQELGVASSSTTILAQISEPVILSA